MLPKLSSLNLIDLHPVFTGSWFTRHSPVQDILQQRPEGKISTDDKIYPYSDPLMN